MKDNSVITTFLELNHAMLHIIYHYYVRNIKIVVLLMYIKCTYIL